ncbi:alpha/beta hydrolase [Chitinophaga pollutisoli]|uniref:Alpha/beta hydrolase n=1 Tax=Chitinophaga pollutisoli TaxID=3133966 RepID=A0ABZ2YQK1_9BACT
MQSSVFTLTPGQEAAVRAPTQFADVGGRQLAYRSIGAGDPILLCQRFRGNLDDWDPAFLAALAEYYQVIYFDYGGMASSTGEPHEHITAFASDVMGLADALSINRFLLLGWSFGGWVVQAVTALFPERVRQAILIGTRPPGPPAFDLDPLFLEVAFRPVNTFEDEVILFFEPDDANSVAAARKSHDRIRARTENQDTPVKPEHWGNYRKGGEYFSGENQEYLQRLRETDIPILVISGDHEICFPPENWFTLNRQLPTTQVIVIPRAGHGPQHQYPALTAAYIHAFVSHHPEH